MLSGQNSIQYLTNQVLLANIINVLKYRNNLNQVVYKVYMTLPLSYLTLISALKWNLQTGFQNLDSFTFNRNQNFSVNYNEESNKIVYEGYVSGNVGLTNLISNPGKIFYQTLESSSQIQNIQQIYDIGYIFIVKKTLLVFDIAQYLFVEEIKLDNEGDNSLEYIQGFQYSKQQKLITCFKSQYFAILNCQQNLKIQNILTNFSYISNYYLQEEKQIIYIYGSNIFIYDLQLKDLKIIYESNSYIITQCVFLLSYLVCQTAPQQIKILENQSFFVIKTFSSIEIQDQSFLLADQVYRNIYIYKTQILSFSISEQSLNQILVQNSQILQLNIFGSKIVIFTNQNGFILDRNSQQQQAVFQLFGNFIGNFYLGDYNHLLYYTDNITQGQIFVFSLTTLSQLPALKAFFPLNQVRSVFHDQALSIIGLTDEQEQYQAKCIKQFLDRKYYYL
ncbi:hypothetical protein TTHERM_000112878 (macronuclear) [Tetrahymena thermophila SB210]|uniref:Uncharacterized protein n=1 Tax=Tetrahymena thermophila (strain SB210) TaxID=312017 RepID=W7XJP8_TETTS|nr:hypothetical protein TTHERM_000112878 [Tetrahymena thermophila SB210]EWS75771.1 hypothetical protein TTHERM_000112878 [Tetrahymena thermophila SB210]|eukprot:XP_012651693.1 hypothetical protein TTHERM_000112878 [Tetrahymena thermophila SB210]